MRITKHEHACLEIEVSGSTLIIDPGSFTTLLVGTNDVVGVVITHNHPDHWTDDQLEHILKRNPDARVISTAEVADASEHQIEVVAPGMSAEVGPFTLEFSGGEHAEIHPTVAVPENLAVHVNDTLYYAGDSFTVPDFAVDTLAVPASAPWLKISEVMDYVDAVTPKRAFPVHEMLHSTLGKNLFNTRIQAVVEAGGGEFFALEPGGSLDV